MAYDILVKDGTIFDGTGKARFQGDIGIEQGVIRDIGAPNLPGADGKKVISALGKYVAPGFIDITSHADKNWSLFLNPMQDILLTQGVTTVLIGNCGTSLAPLASPEAAESLRAWTQGIQTNTNWLTVGEFLAELSRHPLGVNVGTLIGYGTVRRGILRDQARAMNVEETQQAVGLITRGITEGAFGLSTGLAYEFESPSSMAELATALRAVAEAGAIHKAHLRSEGGGLLGAMNEMVQIGRESGVPTVISHVKAVGRKSWPSFQKALDMLSHANQEREQFSFDMSPYARTGSSLHLLLPSWAVGQGIPDIMKRIETADGRKTIIEGLQQQTLHYDRYIVASAGSPNTNGHTIAEIAERTGRSPEETVIELLAANHGRVTIFGKTLSPKNILAGMAHPLAIIASDGMGVSAELGRTGRLVHPRSTGTFPHFLHRFVNEKQVMAWEEGIRKITALPAHAVGLRNRGQIQRKYHADLVVFDPERIRDRGTYQNPYVHSVGIEAVVVNGKLAIAESELTGEAAGAVLKKSS